MRRAETHLTLALLLAAAAAGGEAGPPASGKPEAPATEARAVAENLVMDMLERVGQSQSDVELFFGQGAKAPFRREMGIALLLEALAVPEDARGELTRVLESGGVKAFEMRWEPGVMRGYGKQRAFRKDRVWCRAVGPSGTVVERFRIFCVRSWE